MYAKTFHKFIKKVFYFYVKTRFHMKETNQILSYKYLEIFTIIILINYQKHSLVQVQQNYTRRFFFR